MLRNCGLILLFMVSGGCAMYRDPSVRVFSAGLSQSTPEAAVLHLMLDLANPNDESLKLLDVEYEVHVNGVKAYSGVRSAETTLAGNDQRHMRLPAVIRHDQVSGMTDDGKTGGGAYTINGRVRYLAPGELARMFRDMGFPHPTVAFSGGGPIASP